MSYTKRLTRDKSYNKPAQTFQESLTNAQIKDALKEYKKTTNILQVPINTHIRYFITDKKGNKVFRLGGVLTKIGDNQQYVILSNGTFSWSAQIATSIFYQKMSEAELKNEMKAEIKKQILTETNDNELVEKNKELEKDNKNLLKKLEHLTDKIKYIENEISKAKSSKNKK
jgi:hypothetical protein